MSWNLNFKNELENAHAAKSDFNAVFFLNVSVIPIDYISGDETDDPEGVIQKKIIDGLYLRVVGKD